MARSRKERVPVPKPTEVRKYLTIPEAAKLLRISTHHLYKLVSTGKITHYKPNGKKIYFRVDDLERYIESCVYLGNNDLKGNTQTQSQIILKRIREEGGLL